MAVLVTLLAVVVALLGVLVAGLLRSHAEILRALHELGAGLDPGESASRVTAPRVRSSEPVFQRGASRVASDLSGETPAGDAISVAIAGAEHPTLLAFLTTGCTTCADFWTAFSHPGLRVPGGARLVAVLKGAEAESVVRARKLAPPEVPVVMSSPAWDAYDVPVAPYFVLVDGPTSEIVGEGASNTWPQLASMMDRALEESGIEARRSDPRARRRRTNDKDRADRVDGDLLAAGIEPGDPSLYPSAPTGEGRTTR
jgi:hypothetical protein